jgi:uncharacterized protein (DUF697 family)
MFLNEDEIRKQFENAIKGIQGKDAQANAVIAAAIAINAGIGIMPFGINITVLMLVCAVMLTVIGSIYGYLVNLDEGAKLAKQIILSAGWVYAANILGWKIIAEIAKIGGVATAGTVTGIAMGVDAVLFGALTYAIGYTSKQYFAKDRMMSDREMGNLFKQFFKFSKSSGNGK